MSNYRLRVELRAFMQKMKKNKSCKGIGTVECPVGECSLALSTPFDVPRLNLITV